MGDCFYKAGMCLLIILCALFIAALAKAQEIHHHEGASQEVDKFYSTWMSPVYRNREGQRMQGCCNKKDCRPAIIRYNEEKKRWEGRYVGPVYQREFWLGIPDQTLEENATDAKESPDGQSHMCGSNYNVFCAVRGSGQ